MVTGSFFYEDRRINSHWAKFEIFYLIYELSQKKKKIKPTEQKAFFCTISLLLEELRNIKEKCYLPQYDIYIF